MKTKVLKVSARDPVAMAGSVRSRLFSGIARVLAVTAAVVPKVRCRENQASPVDLLEVTNVQG